MKKLAILLGLILLSVNCCLAKSPEYELELGRLKNAKSAKYKVIDAQIRAISDKVVDLTNDTTISSDEKQKLFEQCATEIQELKDQKTLINYKYVKAKKNLRKRY
ncbi:hypothetical protein BHV42_02950 [Candidatus Melainabacteria bacterium MEL.A1]|nr:hypothetical protein BHV42_02950 [Candidatus Melainabacteria bacterium MEL.A1]